MKSDYSWNDLVKISVKCGFYIFEGAKHTKIKNKKGEFITTIPRHSHLKKALVLGILKAFKLAGCNTKK